MNDIAAPDDPPTKKRWRLSRRFSSSSASWIAPLIIFLITRRIIVCWRSMPCRLYLWQVHPVWFFGLAPRSCSCF